MWHYKEKIKVVLPPSALTMFFQNIMKKKSFFCNVVGDTGKGKSELILSICEKDRFFCLEKNVIHRIENVKPSIMNILEDRKSSFLLLDDFGKELDPNRFYTDPALAMSWIGQTARTLHIGVFITTPDQDFINKTFRVRVPNFIILVSGYNKVSEYTKFKLQRIQRNKKTGKTYYHNLSLTTTHIITQNKQPEYIPIEDMYMKRPSREIREEYKKLREKIALECLEERPRHQNKKIEELKQLAEKAKNELGENIYRIYGGKKRINVSLIAAELGISDKKATKIAALLQEK